MTVNELSEYLQEMCSKGFGDFKVTILVRNDDMNVSQQYDERDLRDCAVDENDRTVTLLEDD